MAMRKNIANQFAVLQAWLTTNDTAVTGDSANISAFISINGAAEAAATNSVTELDATNCPGVYLLALTQGETNGELIVVTGTSSTGNVRLRADIIRTEQWTYDGISYETVIETIMATLFGVAVRTSTGVAYRLRDGTTLQLTVTHDTVGNRTVSTIS